MNNIYPKVMMVSNNNDPNIVDTFHKRVVVAEIDNNFIICGDNSIDSLEKYTKHGKIYNIQQLELFSYAKDIPNNFPRVVYVYDKNSKQTIKRVAIAQTKEHYIIWEHVLDNSVEAYLSWGVDSVGSSLKTYDLPL